jgi:hypothetical protein
MTFNSIQAEFLFSDECEISDGQADPIEGIEYRIPKLVFASGEVNLWVHPNPMTGQATFSFSLAEPTIITLSVYNTLGEEVACLIEDQYLPAGEQVVIFKDHGLAPGVYTYRLQLGEAENARIIGDKMIILK